LKDAGHKRVSRRLILKGLGGAAVALPFLESLVLDRALGQSQAAEPFVIFLRQANGVAQEQDSPNELGYEPDRFWPRSFGALTRDGVSGRALEELEPHLGRILAVANVNYNWFEYGDGHAMGAMQALTARGPVVERAGNSAEAAGESLDHRIGRELNPAGRDSLFLYAGRNDGWLGGACISYRESGLRRNPLHNPWNAYQHLVGGAGGLSSDVAARIAQRRESVNDLVRAQLDRIRNHRRLGSSDRRRLDLHLQAIREVEVAVGCRMAEDRERVLANESPGFDSTDGDEVLRTARLHADIAVLAVACGYTRSVAIQVGNGNDGHTRFRDPDTGALMENYHYISHRRTSHGSDGAVIPGSDLLHHKIDRQFAATFRHLLDRMSSFDTGAGDLLDQGLAVWYNDNSNGPPHGIWNVPWILAGSAGGYFRQGEYLRLPGASLDVTHARLLNTIGTAVGVRNGSGGPMNDFGDPNLPRGIIDELRA
jgi:hypothetical protein